MPTEKNKRDEGHVNASRLTSLTLSSFAASCLRARYTEESVAESSSKALAASSSNGITPADTSALTLSYVPGTESKTKKTKRCLFYMKHI